MEEIEQSDTQDEDAFDSSHRAEIFKVVSASIAVIIGIVLLAILLFWFINFGLFGLFIVGPIIIVAVTVLLIIILTVRVVMEKRARLDFAPKYPIPVRKYLFGILAVLILILFRNVILQWFGLGI